MGKKSLVNRVIEEFRLVQAFPYKIQNSRNMLEAVRDRHSGCCLDKNIYLAEQLKGLGSYGGGTDIMVTVMEVLFRWSEQPIPKEVLAQLPEEGDLTNHIYLQITYPDRDDEVIVDATWPIKLLPYGFSAVENWDGRTSMQIGVIKPYSEPRELDHVPVGGSFSKNKSTFYNTLNKVLGKCQGGIITPQQYKAWLAGKADKQDIRSWLS